MIKPPGKPGIAIYFSGKKTTKKDTSLSLSSFLFVGGGLNYPQKKGQQTTRDVSSRRFSSKMAPGLGSASRDAAPGCGVSRCAGCPKKAPGSRSRRFCRVFGDPVFSMYIVIEGAIWPWVKIPYPTKIDKNGWYPWF